MFSCCRANPKAAKKDKDKDKQCKNDANETNEKIEQLPANTANEQVTQEEVKANGQVSKPEPQEKPQPQPEPEPEREPESEPQPELEPEAQTEPAAATEKESLPIERPTGIHNMYYLRITLNFICKIRYAVPLLGALIHALLLCIAPGCRSLEIGDKKTEQYQISSTCA